MEGLTDSYLSEQLQERRKRLQIATSESKENSGLLQLLHEVDEALKRMEMGTFGLCETCHDPIEKDRLLADPCLKYCLDHLTVEEQKTLEQDLELASKIQGQFLPEQNLTFNGWEISYHYEAAGPVSGDYCDLIKSDDGSIFFLLGDVAGKGISASMLMAHLHAIFRTLIASELSLPQMLVRANRLFSQTTMADSYATLVCGRANRSGDVELCNAGHCPPLVSQPGRISNIEATGLPIGIFPDGQFGSKMLRLHRGDSLVIYSDGLSEARDVSNREYGTERLSSLLRKSFGLSSQELVAASTEDLFSFRQGTRQTDDLSIMVLRRVE